MQRIWIHPSSWVKWVRRPGVHLFFFCGFLVLLCWPILIIAESMEPYWSVVVYLFGLWAVMIAVVIFVAVGCLAHHKAARCQGKSNP